MRVSLSWIKRLLNAPDLGMSATELQTQLSLHVAEIEPHLERSGPALDGVVVGKVLTCVQHPNADKLRLTTVDVGRAVPLSIVCGAPNVAVGQTVAVATIGTTLSMKQPDGSAKALTIKAAKLRGEPSEGMICAEDELGLGPSHDGIMILSDALVVGTPLGDALGLGDTVFVLENASITHRPDLWGHLGWAREVAVITGKQTPAPPDISWQSRGEGWGADIRDEGCVTYFGAVIEGVRNIPSPQWMQDHLNAVGVRPLGLLVDVTNYVMLELGEPMHAFDLRDIAGKRIEVRAARDGESFTTLDGKTHKLAVGDLLIADADKALALAGIMGGHGSMVRDDTSSILLEGAIFRADRIRRTRQRTGLSTDSSARFEKGLYPELAPAALNRAIALIDQLIPSCRITHRFAAGAGAGEARSIPFAPNMVKRLIGIDVEPATQRGILDRLGFRVGDKVEVPWWRRKDVHSSADLVEEIARHHGYQKIYPVIPRLAAEAPPVNELRRAEHRARQLMSGLGWDEVQTYAFTSEAWIAALGLDALNLIKLAHPLSSEQTVMRPSLVPTLIEALGRNRKHFDEVRIYEIGKRYRIGLGGRGRSDGMDDETLVIAGVCAAVNDECPFYAARDAALRLVRGIQRAGGPDVRLRELPEPEPWLVAGRARGIHLGEDRRSIGTCAEVTPAIRAHGDCPERVGYFEILLEDVIRALGDPRPVGYRSPSRFQRVEREFTWVCADALPYGDLADASRTGAGDLCAGVTLITIYRGQPYPSGQKAVSVLVALQSDERTLEEKDINQAADRIIARVQADTGATLRRGTG